MSKRWRITISFFIAFNILAALIAPIKPRANQNPIERFFYPYALWTRIIQEWSLFSPNPRKSMVYYKFEISFKDTTKKIWVRPYSENWDFFQRHLAYNWQKLDLAGHNLDNPVLYDDLADYIKRKFWSDTNPPKMIRLLRSQAQWPPPQPHGDAWSSESSLHWADDELFKYLVDEDKFIGNYEKHLE